MSVGITLNRFSGFLPRKFYCPILGKPLETVRSLLS